MPVLADDDVVVHGNPQRLGDVDDGLRHLDVGLRRRGIAAWVIVHHTTRQRSVLYRLRILAEKVREGTRIGDGTR